MDPLNIHHVIRHRLSRIQTTDFQDKSGCSINGFRSFLFEQGIVEDLDDVEKQIGMYSLQDYKGYPIQLGLNNDNYNFPLSDEILRMKNVSFYFHKESKPIHKLVSPEPHFVEEEKNILENHFSYMGKSYDSDDIEDWKCFEMDNEGHLVSMIHFTNFHFSNEAIEHLPNFPRLRHLSMNVGYEEYGTNFSLLSNLRMLSIRYGKEIQNPELLKDLGMFTNLLSLSLSQSTAGNLLYLNHILLICFRYDRIASRFFQFIQFSFTFFDKLHFSRF